MWQMWTFVLHQGATNRKQWKTGMWKLHYSYKLLACKVLRQLELELDNKSDLLRNFN